MKPATEILWSAAFVLDQEENWFGRGKPSHAGDERMCAYIAISEAARVLHPLAANDALSAAYQAVAPCPSIIGYNDSHTHAEVLEALYKAAELSEAA